MSHQSYYQGDPRQNQPYGAPPAQPTRSPTGAPYYAHPPTQQGYTHPQQQQHPSSNQYHQQAGPSGNHLNTGRFSPPTSSSSTTYSRTSPTPNHPTHFQGSGPPLPPSPYGNHSPSQPGYTHIRVPQPPPPPPGAAPPQFSRPTAQHDNGSRGNLSARPHHVAQPSTGTDIISMYASSPTSPTQNPGYQQAQHPPSQSFLPPSIPSSAGLNLPLGRTQSAAGSYPNLRPQYPQHPFSSPSIPTISSPAPLDTANMFASTGSLANGYGRDGPRRPPEHQSSAPEVPSRPSISSSSRPRPSIDQEAVATNWNTPTYDPFASGNSPILPQKSFDTSAAARQAVAEAAGGYYSEERRDLLPELGFSSPNSRASPTPPLTASTAPPLRQGSQPSIKTTPAPSPAPRSDSSSSLHSAFGRAIASRQGTLSPNSSLDANGAWGLSRDDSYGSSMTGNGKDPSSAGHEFLNPSLLSNMAVYVKDKVPKGLNSKGVLEFPDSFTGEQLVTTIQNALPGGNTSDRRHALQIARSLQQALWFNEVDWSDAPIKDSAATVFTFEIALDELPTGIITSQTQCYSPFCGKLNEIGEPTSCYSYTCPNVQLSRLNRAPSVASPSIAESAEEPGDNWLSYVPASVRDATDKAETKRQLVIFELVSSEVAYNLDLDVVQEGFVEPLLAANPPIIPPERQASFLSDVLNNIAEIRQLNHAFLELLLARQKENYVVRGVGDLMLSAAPDWREAYIEYAHKFNLAEAFLKEEKDDNPRFNEFLMDFHKFPKAGRQNFESFHKRPTIRLLRYTLILSEVLKHTPDTHPDHEFLKETIDMIKEIGQACNKSDPALESKVECRRLYRAMSSRKPGERGDAVKDQQDRVVTDLAILSEERRYFQSGKVYRRPDNAAFTDWSENYLILFDHFLLFTKAKERGKAVEYRISRRPVPLELLQFRPNSFTEPPIPRNSGFHLRTGNFRSGGVERSPSDGTHGFNAATESSTLVFPISLYKIGRNEGTITVYVDSKALRDTWETKLRDALELRTKTQEAHKVVALDPLSDRTFSVQRDRAPTCSAPLTVADGQSLVIAGCESGLFIGFRGQTMKQVVALAGITQCAVLHEFGLVIVLAQGVLIAYALEALIPSGRSTDPSLRIPQKLSGKNSALFFRVGKVIDAQGKPLTLIIYNKRGGVKESVFKALEPISLEERQRGGHKGFFGGSKTPEWVRTHKDFYSPSLVLSVQFLKSKLAIILARGVEIMDLTTLRTMSVPDFTKHRHDPAMAVLQKRCDEAKTLAMFRLGDNLFLLVFDEFAFHVDKHGEPIAGRAGSIDWESKPESVAFQFPYIYAFSSNLIEVRHVLTGHLVQVIPGQSISLTYDGTGIETKLVEIRSPSYSSGFPLDPPDRRIHFTMRQGEHHRLFEIAPAQS